ncbi:hypothetical protein FACS1894127_5190 [Clostridia bacterium]|nr:hypothetical protein FACS1894127_5190 [Clostridia bacterium]
MNAQRRLGVAFRNVDKMGVYDLDLFNETLSMCGVIVISGVIVIYGKAIWYEKGLVF